MILGMEQKTTLNDSQMWQAVLQRDHSYDGLFFFGVRSTGIYCRPSCPARRPRREQVEFYLDPDTAEAAGLRACRRCFPRDVAAIERGLEAARRCIETAETPLTLKSLSEAVGISPYHLQRKFKARYGLTPHQYAQAWRSERFKAAVRAGQDVTAALYEAGYSSSSRLYETAGGNSG
jgi:AraC family transcriptional regulator, regulatory protein of adaptative response / methylated-DNA-[protein]-cysteine methyltransferase